MFNKGKKIKILERRVDTLIHTIKDLEAELSLVTTILNEKESIKENKLSLEEVVDLWLNGKAGN